MTDTPRSAETARSRLIETSHLLDSLTNIATPKGSGISQARVSDDQGLTYIGRPSHVALLAMLRRDIVPAVSDSPCITSWVRHAAHTVLLWFTSRHTPRDHAEVFDDLSIQETCRMVAALVNRDDINVGPRVGPESLPLHTAHLLAIAGHPVTDTSPTSWPQVVDPNPSGGLEWCGEPQVLVTTRDGSFTARLHVELTATEELTWRLHTIVDVPAEDVNDLLRYAGTDLGAYIAGNPGLIEGHLDRAKGERKRLHVQAQLVPTTSSSTQDNDSSAGGAAVVVDPAATVTLHYVGRDSEHALTRPPHLDIDDAHSDAEGSYDVFTATVALTPDMLVQVTQNR